MAKRKPLGENPLSEDDVLRGMIRGGRQKRPRREEPPPEPSPTPPAPVAVPPQPSTDAPRLRASRTTTTGNGLLRKTIYFSPEEWQAIRVRAFEEDRPYTDIVREAIRAFLLVPPE